MPSTGGLVMEMKKGPENSKASSSRRGQNKVRRATMLPEGLLEILPKMLCFILDPESQGVSDLGTKRLATGGSVLSIDVNRMLEELSWGWSQEKQRG